jgi:hypothetical protein
MRNYPRRVKFSASPQPPLPPPLLSPGSLRDVFQHSAVGPEIRK